MKKYYKVVSKNLSSARAWPSILYKVGEFVTPNISKSKLFVFDNLSDAIEFSHFTEKIFECEVTNPSKPQFFCHLGGPKYIKLFWKLRNSKKKLSGYREFKRVIPGTIFCDTVKLTREIIV